MLQEILRTDNALIFFDFDYFSFLFCLSFRDALTCAAHCMKHADVCDNFISPNAKLPCSVLPSNSLQSLVLSSENDSNSLEIWTKEPLETGKNFTIYA